MEAWLVWLIAAIVFAVGEMATLGLFLAPFAGGALVASIIAGAGVGTFAQWASFLVVSIALLLGLRPIARSHRKMPAQIRTGTAALVGKSGVVLERIANHEGVGLVRIATSPGSARAITEEGGIEPGRSAQV